MGIKFNKNDIYDVYLVVNKFYGKYIIEDDRILFGKLDELKLKISKEKLFFEEYKK